MRGRKDNQTLRGATDIPRVDVDAPPIFTRTLETYAGCSRELGLC